MKIRHPLLLRVIPLLGAWLLRAWFWTLRLRVVMEDPSLDPRRFDTCGNHLYLFWHDGLLLPAYLFAPRRQYMLASQSKDGELIARLCEHMGWRVLRGSSSRGGVAVIRQMLELARGAGPFQIGIAGDGPRGPARAIKTSTLAVAARVGLTIVPLGFAFDRPWRARGWDKMILPRPFARAAMVGGKSLRIPPRANEQELEHYRDVLYAELERLEEAARCLMSGPMPAAAAPSPSLPTTDPQRLSA